MLMETLRNLKAPAAQEIIRTTVTVFATPELSETERAIAEKLAGTDEAIKAGRYREAISMSSAVIDLNPKLAAPWQNLGIAYLGLEKYKSSLYAWEKAYEYDESRRMETGYLVALPAY